VPDVAAQNTLELFGTKGALIAHGTIGQDPTGNMFSILQPQETAIALTSSATSKSAARSTGCKDRVIRPDDRDPQPMHC